MKEGPPATIWGGRWVRGQFSMLMMDSLLQRASSNGRLCRLGLSLRYSSSKFSSVPEDRHYGVLVKPNNVILGNGVNNIQFLGIKVPLVTALSSSSILVLKHFSTHEMAHEVSTCTNNPCETKAQAADWVWTFFF